MKKITFIIALFIIACPVIFAQIEKQTANLNIEGQIAATTNAKALFINLGGPALKFSLPKFSIAITLFPTFKFEETASKLVVSPCLGFGPRLYFLKDKRFILEFPCYCNASKNIWTASAGFGYVLTKPKKQ
jgi:hypothetical protein